MNPLTSSFVPSSQLERLSPDHGTVPLEAVSSATAPVAVPAGAPSSSSEGAAQADAGALERPPAAHGPTQHHGHARRQQPRQEPALRNRVKRLPVSGLRGSEDLDEFECYELSLQPDVPDHEQFSSLCSSPEHFQSGEHQPAEAIAEAGGQSPSGLSERAQQPGARASFERSLASAPAAALRLENESRRPQDKVPAQNTVAGEFAPPRLPQSSFMRSLASAPAAALRRQIESMRSSPDKLSAQNAVPGGMGLPRPPQEAMRLPLKSSQAAALRRENESMRSSPNRSSAMNVVVGKMGLSQPPQAAMRLPLVSLQAAALRLQNESRRLSQG